MEMLEGSTSEELTVATSTVAAIARSIPKAVLKTFRRLFWLPLFSPEQLFHGFRMVSGTCD